MTKKKTIESDQDLQDLVDSVQDDVHVPNEDARRAATHKAIVADEVELIDTNPLDLHALHTSLSHSFDEDFYNHFTHVTPETKIALDKAREAYIHKYSAIVINPTKG